MKRAISLLKNKAHLIKKSHYIINNKLKANSRECNLFSVKLDTPAAQHEHLDRR